MSVVYFNLILVAGPQRAVLRFRKDARQRLSPTLRKAFGTPQIDLSLDRLFRTHRLAAPSRKGLPGEDGHYHSSALPVTKWHSYDRALYEIEVKNYQIHELLLPLSQCYGALCFVDSEMCLDDGSIISVCVTEGRSATWALPEKRQTAHWKRAAKRHGVAKLTDAFEDDSVRSDAEDAMLSESLAHWDKRVLRVLGQGSRS